ncbi:hypothetical protein RSSM_03466 [Rhodopirellula sallentina SM41]|uniref:Uncharacterized protein n=1 Tax=Rhodopirellula sallentina SM41 TaxID=1263870 RepID=M5U116_9BACT|nr:hypothetical protein RSSM_03466 [Rhodopirellula sallentina SM41]
MFDNDVAVVARLCCLNSGDIPLQGSDMSNFQVLSNRSENQVN